MIVHLRFQESSSGVSIKSATVNGEPALIGRQSIESLRDLNGITETYVAVDLATAETNSEAAGDASAFGSCIIA